MPGRGTRDAGELSRVFVTSAEGHAPAWRYAAPMQDRDLPQAEWAVRFGAALRRLGSCADSALLADRGCTLWETHNGRGPTIAAESAFGHLPLVANGSFRLFPLQRNPLVDRLLQHCQR